MVSTEQASGLLSARDGELGDGRHHEQRAALQDLLFEVGHVDLVVGEPDLRRVDALEMEPSELGAQVAGVHWSILDRARSPVVGR